MNPILQFYSALLSYLQHKKDVDQTRNKLLDIASRCSSLCWTVEDRILSMLFNAAHEESSLDVRRTTEEFRTENQQKELRQNFRIWAFKDLSPMKNPLAMKLFGKLNELGPVRSDERSQHVIWARKIHKRADGSAVINLHVSCLTRFSHQNLHGRGADFQEGFIEHYGQHLTF